MSVATDVLHGHLHLGWGSAVSGFGLGVSETLFVLGLGLSGFGLANPATQQTKNKSLKA